MSKLIMKKLLLPLLAISLFSNAQRVYERQPNINRPYLENESENWILHINPLKKVKTVEWKGKKDTDRSYMVLNEKGYLLEKKYTAYVKGFLFFEPKKHFHTKFGYTDLLCTKVDFHNSEGKLISSDQYEFFSPTKVRVSKTYKKDKLIFEGISRFNPDSTTAEYKAMNYKDGVAKQRVRYENDYYSGKQLKETRQYDRKNKLVQVWKYDCDPKGDVKEKKTNQVCRNVGSDNKEREIEVLFNTDHKGKKTKTINTFYKVNGKRFNVTSEWYMIKKGKEIKWYEEHYPDSIESWYNYRFYGDKGVLQFEQKREYSQYSSKGVIFNTASTFYYRKKKVNSKFVLTYNEKGLVQKNEVFNKKLQITSKREWTYIGDTLVTSKDYNRKGKVKGSQSCHISYY
jgi:hypothetical protein